MTDTKIHVASTGTVLCNGRQVPLGYLREEFHVLELLEEQTVFSCTFTSSSGQSGFSTLYEKIRGT